MAAIDEMSETARPAAMLVYNSQRGHDESPAARGAIMMLIGDEMSSKYIRVATASGIMDAVANDYAEWRKHMAGTLERQYLEAQPMLGEVVGKYCTRVEEMALQLADVGMQQSTRSIVS